MSVTPFYEDGQVTLYCADFRAVEVPAESVAAAVTSPPYNVGLDYHAGDDSLDWPAYGALAAAAAGVMARSLVGGGRSWVNTAVSVPAGTGAGAKERVMLAFRWAQALEGAGLSLVDQVAWCSARGAGTAWGSWASPACPNLRGDWESLLVACSGRWERTAPAFSGDGWRDAVGGWESLCSTVWHLAPARRDRHPAPFPMELARRAIRLSTWPDEVVFDPFAGSGTTLLAALSLMLSQGRGPAVTVIGAMQDPRKDIVAFRDLFPVRVGLRMVEAEQTDMVLGKGARNRGAACELIHEELRGVGYQLLDGHQHPTRVRAAWISDDDIDAVARDFSPGHRPTNGDDPVVIDLRDKAPERDTDR